MVRDKKLSAERLAKKISVTIHMARDRASKLGLRALRSGYEEWTEEEDELLTKFVHLDLITIAKKFRAAGFRRSETALSLRRSKLGLTASNGEYYSACELGRLMGIGTVPVLRWIRLGWLEAKPRGQSIAEHGGPGDRWNISAGAVYRMITTHTMHVQHVLRTADMIWLVDLLAGGGAALPRATLRQEAAGMSDPDGGGLTEMRVAA